jgi:FkbM family methyltransferase
MVTLKCIREYRRTERDRKLTDSIVFNYLQSISNPLGEVNRIQLNPDQIRRFAEDQNYNLNEEAVIESLSRLERRGMISSKRLHFGVVSLCPAGQAVGASKLLRRYDRTASTAVTIATLLAPLQTLKYLYSEYIKWRVTASSVDSVGQVKVASRFHLFPRNNYDKWYINKPSERQLIRQFVRLVRTGDVVLDCGASIGLWTAHISDAVGPHGHVYAFEPERQSFANLRSMTLYNRLPNVDVFNVALGCSSGPAPFWVRTGRNTHSLYERSCLPDGNTGTRVVVACESLDELLERGEIRVAPTMIKLDVEGAEVMVLKGATAVCKTLRCALIEIHQFSLQKTGYEDPWHVIEALMRDAGLTQLKYYDCSHLMACRPPGA